MSKQRFEPVLIGVGDVVNRSTSVEDAREPAQLMLEAIEKALEDTHVANTKDLKQLIDSIDVVACWTWPYDDLPGLLAHKLRIKPRHQHIPVSHGGNQPAQLLDDAAKRVSLGQSEIAVVCGGEALASLAACAKSGKLPPPSWTKISQDIDSVFSPTTRELEVGIGRSHRIGAPIQIYPLYENAFRAFRHQSFEDNNVESARLYERFAQVAQNHPFAWNYQKSAETAGTIGTPSQRNRMICFPYPLLMNAFNLVNLSAACIVTSTKIARKLGVPESKWVYPLGGAGTRDSHNFWDRPNYHTSPSISRSLDAALAASQIHKDEVDTFEFYSCFPIVPKLACHHVGISISDPEKPITVLGGLTSFGGAGNNYSMHAITEMTRKIRDGTATTGLVLANGGWLTYQHVICLSSRSRSAKSPYPTADPLPGVLEGGEPRVDANVEGEATLETYTVDYDRSGKPIRGHIVGRLESNNHRFIANHADISTITQLVDGKLEPIGRKGIVWRDVEKEGRNLFSFTRETKL